MTTKSRASEGVAG